MFSFWELLEKSGLQKDSWWNGNSSATIFLSIGLNNFDKTQYLTLGENSANHVLISGCVGSGKSQLMHLVLTIAMMIYSPNEIQIYILDLKEGIEYKHYNDHQLPHVRKVAAGVGRETGYEILQEIDEELALRKEMITQNGFSSLCEYRQLEQINVPRILCIIDEFQSLFAWSDYVYSNSSIILDRLVREGSTLGMHLLLSSQTLSQADDLLLETLKKITLRIAFSSNHIEEARAILADGNLAPTQLSKPGEAIYNEDSGAVQGNKHFQAAYISMDELKCYLEEISTLNK